MLRQWMAKRQPLALALILGVAHAHLDWNLESSFLQRLN